MKDRAKYIQLGVANGVTSLDEIRKEYNKYAEGGELEKYTPETLAGFITSLTTDDTNTIIGADVASSSLNLSADAIPVYGTAVGALISAGDALYNIGKLIYKPSWGAASEAGFTLAGILPGVGNLKDAAKVAKGNAKIAQNVMRTKSLNAAKKTITRRPKGKPKAKINTLNSRGEVISSYREPLFDYSNPLSQAIGTVGNFGYSIEDLIGAGSGFIKHNSKNKNNNQNSYDLGGALSRFISRFTEEDTKDQYPTFNEAFRAARIADKDYFKWNRELYNTELHPTVLEKQALNILGVTKKQNDRMTDTWDYLRSNNVSARNAAAFMGNIMQESSFNPKARQIDGDKAVGLFQLHGDRLDDYKKFLQENNKEDNTHSQLDYMISLVKGERGDAYMDEYYRVRNLRDSLENTNNIKEYTKVSNYFNRMYKKREETNTLYPIKDLTKAWEDETMSLDDLTDLFTNTIERAGKPEYETRRTFANKFYNHFYGVPKLAPTK